MSEPKMDAKMRAQEEQWQAESDARLMANYQELMDDKPRLRRAVKQAREEAKRLQERANAMSKVSKTQGNKEDK